MGQPNGPRQLLYALERGMFLCPKEASSLAGTKQLPLWAVAIGLTDVTVCRPHEFP